jgi:hypothetical protein
LIQAHTQTVSTSGYMKYEMGNVKVIEDMLPLMNGIVLIKRGRVVPVRDSPFQPMPRRLIKKSSRTRLAENLRTARS